MGSDRLALLVDGDNVSAKVITGVLAEIAKHGTASVRRIYGDWTLPNLGPWKKCLLEHSIQPVQQFAYTTGKNATDGAMIIDAMDLLYTGRFDGFCLVSSDSDFTRLAVRIREQGVTVYGFGERKTPRPLISACDRFYYFHALETGPSIDEARPTNNADAVARRPVVPAIQGDQADAAVSPITAPARSGPATGRLDGEALKILRMAVEACAEDDGQANLANVGSYLTKQSPDFNAANYGFKKLRDLAEASGILKVELVQRKSAAPVCMVQLNDTSEKVKKRRRLSYTASETYDIIIIGGGTAGLVLANRLSENKSLQVLVIESGQDRTSDPSTLTPGAWPLLANPSTSWTFQTTQQHETGRKVITVPQGRALGGSSAINSFLFVPTSKAHVEAWEKLGNEGWSYEAFEKALRKASTLHKTSGAKEGDGPLQVRVSKLTTPLQKAWVDGLESIGFPRSDPFAGHACGAVIAPESIDPATKQRSYATNAYLDPVRSRANLTVLTETTVTKVLLDKPSSGTDAVAKGVQYTTKDGTSQTVKARKEVIISAGTINSPRLLELSGIGGAKLLQGLGVEVFVDNPHVGENLQNHIFTGVSFEVNEDVHTIDAFFRQEPEAVAAAMQEYATKGTGPMSTSNMITTAHLPLPEFHTDEGREDLQQLLSTLGSNDDAQDSSPTTTAFAAAHEGFVRSVLTDPQQPLGHYVMGPAYVPFDASPAYRAPGKWISVAIEIAHPLSRGSVHITSAAPEHAGSNEGVSVDPRYLSHQLDLEIMARQLRFTEQVIGRSEPLARHLKPRQDRWTDLADAREYVKRTVDGSHHYVGTCSMMPRALGGVVDERLRVHGCSNLRVCDASIVPIQAVANTQSVVYGLAELGASLIKEDVQ